MKRWSFGVGGAWCHPEKIPLQVETFRTAALPLNGACLKKYLYMSEIQAVELWRRGAWCHPEKIPLQVETSENEAVELWRRGAWWHPEEIPSQVETFRTGRTGAFTTDTISLHFLCSFHILHSLNNVLVNFC